jgi:OPT family oligopeptide transporter
MAIKQLTEEQVRTWSVEQKDRWWLENVYQGDIPQFTFRAVVCGFLLGGVLSITNLYVGAKTGWTLGVGITSVILAYLVFQTLIRVGLVDTYHVLENNIMQSIATAAGYMTAPLISSLGAYMMVKSTIVPPWQAVLWLIGLAVLGVLFAFPMKRRFINDEQHPFPEGRAAGVVMDALHSTEGGGNTLPARLLLWFGIGAGAAKFLQSHDLLERIKIRFLGIPEFFDEWIYSMGYKPALMGTTLKELTVRPELDIAMIGAGGLMGIRTGVSLMVGAIINYVFLAPYMIQQGDILGGVDADGATVFGFRRITEWALWPGVAMMTTASLFAFFAKPAMLVSAFAGMFSRREARQDPVKHIELPMSVFVLGIPLVGAAVVWMAHSFFGVPWFWGAVAVPLVFVFCLIAANSTALTSITPTGAMGKLTQLTFAVLVPKDIGTNLMTAGITGEVASNSSNLMMNIKPGYMLGGKPRLQALGHCIGVVSGALASVVVFYPLFLRGNPDGLISEEFPMPALAVWKAVAEILTEGISTLPASAAWAALVGGLAGIILEIIRMAAKGKFPISGVGVGLAFVIPFTTCLAMAFGSFVFWALAKRFPREEDPVNRVFVQNQEPICAGVIAGAALMGIGVMAYTVLWAG